jgi:hypothetical protein
MSNIQQIALSRYIPTEAIEKENRSGWIDYGNDNLYPQYLINLYYNSPIHNALTNSIAFMIEGQGTGTILDSALQGIAFDLKLQGAFVAEVIWSMDFTRVVKINHLPFENCRLAYDKEEEEITGIWYSKDWKNSRSKKGKPEFIPAFNPSQAQEQPRQVIYAHGMMAGSSYYPKPDYFGSLNYVELSHQMGLYHVNNILNGLFPSFIINFLNGIPQKEEREAIRREWEERLSGASNAGKFLMTFNEDPTRTPDIQAFPLSDADKQYQFLSEETAKQIMVGHRVVSPLIHGIRESNGFGSNKDEMLVGLEIFNNQVIKPYQRIITNTFAPILGSDLKIEMNNVFDDVTVVVEPTTQSIELKKKVVAVAENKISKEQGDAWLAHLREKAEYINEEEWQLLSDEEVTNPDDEENFRSEFMSVRGYAKPNEKSDEKDTGLYKVRYYYSKNFTYKDGEIVTRDFCQEMVALSKLGALFKYEDIIQMGKDGVNDAFAPSGSNTYSIWTYKGGVYCRHAWFRKVFFRKRKDGKFLPNNGLKNDTVVTGAIANELFPKRRRSGTLRLTHRTRGSLKYP